MVTQLLEGLHGNLASSSLCVGHGLVVGAFPRLGVMAMLYSVHK